MGFQLNKSCNSAICYFIIVQSLLQCRLIVRQSGAQSASKNTNKNNAIGVVGVITTQ